MLAKYNCIVCFTSPFPCILLLVSYYSLTALYDFYRKGTIKSTGTVLTCMMVCKKKDTSRGRHGRLLQTTYGIYSRRDFFLTSAITYNFTLKTDNTRPFVHVHDVCCLQYAHVNNTCMCHTVMLCSPSIILIMNIQERYY